MKKSLSPMTVSCALLCFLAIVSCQRSVTVPTPSLQSKIVGKWTMVSAIVNNTAYGATYSDTTAYTSADYYDFKADSTLSIFATGVTYNGRWEIDDARLYITGTNYMDFAGGFGLPVLDQHNLLIRDSVTAPGVISEQNLILSR
jgi:hypothetical protein